MERLTWISGDLQAKYLGLLERFLPLAPDGAPLSRPGLMIPDKRNDERATSKQAEDD
jgi:hypothetical protein